MTVRRIGGDIDKWIGLSTDSKPNNAPIGSYFVVEDNDDVYLRTKASWLQLLSGGSVNENAEFTGDKIINGSARINQRAGVEAAIDVRMVDGNDVLRVYPDDWPADWKPSTLINSQGAYYSNAWLVISGTPTKSHPSADPFMIGVVSDIDGPAIQVKGAGQVSGRVFDGLDVNGVHRFSIKEDGTLQWGAGNYAAQDVNLYRVQVDVLGTDDNLQLANSVALRWKDGSGTARNILQLDSANILYIGYNGILQTVFLGDYFVRDGPQTLNNMMVLSGGQVGIGTDSFGSGGKGVVAIVNTNAVPSTNPSGGGVLYAEGGALKWRGSSGTVTTIANA